MALAHVGAMIAGGLNHSSNRSASLSVPGATLLTVVLVGIAGAQPVRREFSELHLGMAVRIVVHASDDNAARDAARAAFARIAALEDVMSDYRPTSEVRRLAATSVGHPVQLGADLCAVLRAALAMARASDGAFDPTVKPFADLWRTSRRTGALPPPVALADARRRVGYAHLRLDSAACTLVTDITGVELDVGGIAKGYILDQAMVVVTQRGIESALVEAGGDIVVSGAPPGTTGWRISVPNADAAFAARAGSLAHAAISTSGDTEQFVEVDGRRYSHIIDPRTGLGSTRRTLTTVIARDGMTADALATAIAVMGPEQMSMLLHRYPGALAAARRVE